MHTPLGGVAELCPQSQSHSQPRGNASPRPTIHPYLKTPVICWPACWPPTWRGPRRSDGAGAAVGRTGRGHPRGEGAADPSESGEPGRRGGCSAPHRSASPARATPPVADHFADLVQTMLERGHNLHDPRYIGHQVPAPVPLAGLFDAVGSVTNQVMAIYEMGPWATAVEQAMVAASWARPSAGRRGASPGRSPTAARWPTSRPC